MPEHRCEKRTIAAAILAGGMARRMAGANKATLPVGDRRIIDRQLAVLRQVADPVFIVCRGTEAFGDLAGNPEIVPDRLENAGPLGGIYTAIVSSPRRRTLVVACDMPFLTLPLLEILSRDSDADLVIPRPDAGFEPLCATWAGRCADVIRQRIEQGQLQVGHVLEELRVEEIGPSLLASCDPSGLLFVNVNTPHDYERAQELTRLKSSN